VDSETDRANKIKQMRSEIEDTRREMRKQLSDQALGPSGREKVVVRYVEEILRRTKKMQDFIRDTEISPSGRTPNAAVQ
jgi:hypothetical protein